MIGPDRRSDGRLPISAPRLSRSGDLVSGGPGPLGPAGWQVDLLEALASAINAPDPTSQGHLRRVRQFAGELAWSLGMTDEGVQSVQLAALLHDVGKLAIPEYILSKPGPLTPEEFKRIRTYPAVGADIIRGIPFPYPVVAIIESHRERWDGRGYPAGLKGDEILLGARVLTVVDYFDTLVSDRPYRRAKRRDEALDVLRQERGLALDPRVVDVFIANLAQPAETTGPLDKQEEVRASSFREIALAHRELDALYAIADGLGTSLGLSDAMEHLSSGLSTLMPLSCCALYVQQEHDVLRCVFATGVEAGEVRKLAIRVDEGLAGWVARHRRPLLNARPGADFEAANASSETALKSALVYPLMVNDAPIGILSVYHTAESSYTEDHLRLLAHASHQAAAVIAHSLTFERAQKDALEDALTGLPNARYMCMHAARELARADRLHVEAAVIVADLDHFKVLNDLHGHQFGDRALRETADTIRACLQPYDECGRWFSDKFVVVLTTAGHSVGEGKRQELKHAVDQLRVPAPAATVHLSVSAGVAVFPSDGATWPELLDVAWDRMRGDKGQRTVPP